MRQINLPALVDRARLGRFHLNLILMCTLIIACDGYDLAVVGIALPAMMDTMAIDARQAGWMASAALFGMMLGSIVFGSAAERIGRRLAIAACVTLFSLFTALAGFADDPVEFGVARFIAGIGIGGVMPNAIAQVTEYAPRRVRSMLVALMFSGYSFGGVVAALFGKVLIERHGWPSVFLVAAVPLLFVPLIFKTMPESMSALMKRGCTGELARLAGVLSPGFQPDPADVYLLQKNDARHATWGQLFADGRGPGTLMFWLACFVCLFMVYALNTWLAKLMAAAGFGLGSALTFVAVLNVGAMVGAGGGGWLADRFGSKRVLAVMCALAALSITGLGYLAPAATSWRMVLVALAGASTIGTQIVLSAYAGQFYPADVRSTGLGWMLGIGRMGAILAPILIGLLMAMQLPLEHNFLVIGLPALVAVLAVLLIDDRRSAAVSER